MKLFNSASQQKEEFKPLHEKKVLLYVCGITPYDVTHLGHAATFIFFDVLTRYLSSKGFAVNYTQNITDIDDDILKHARKQGRDWQELGEYWTNYFLEDMKSLDVISPTYFVKATDAIPKIIEIIKRLLKKGLAYQKGGNVYFEVKRFKEYGKLSRYSQNEMIDLSRERGANPDDPDKKDPLDFILWRSLESDVLSGVEGPSWDSPYGKGRPGWHIECSAMISDTLGDRIDIHGGGHDLIFPHHESEIAQSESFTGASPFVRYWMHVAMVRYQGEKMSKSLGNLILVRKLLETYSASAIRFYLLSHHYRKTWEYDEEELKKAEKQISVVKQALRHSGDPDITSGDSRIDPVQGQDPSNEFTALMDNDIDTPAALSLMVELARKKDTSSLETIYRLLGFA